jgi:hypothetical protein
VAVVALVLGGVGWYRYLTRPPAAVTALPVVELPATPEPAPTPRSQAETRAPAAPAPAGPEPLTLSAKELDEALKADPTRPVKEAFVAYRGREVTWSASVVAAGQVNDSLRVELKDDDGTRFIAWCPGVHELAAGTRVTIRGLLESRDLTGFVLERCNVL